MNRRALLLGILAAPFVPKVAPAAVTSLTPISGTLICDGVISRGKALTLAEFAAKMSNHHVIDAMTYVMEKPNLLLADIPFKPVEGNVSIYVRSPA